jgi:hypothetical protein
MILTAVKISVEDQSQLPVPTGAATDKFFATLQTPEPVILPRANLTDETVGM